MSKNKRKIKKSIDVIIYYRTHSNKNNKFIIELVKKLTKKKIKIACVGDKIKNLNVINFGLVSHKRCEDIIKRSKIGINSSDNFYSLFMLDCINNNTNVLCDKNSISEKTNFKTKVLISDYKNINSTSRLIYNFVKRK